MTNRLAQSQSLYLRKHAENPIDWWPWCDDAIATARQEDKPIFLSIGYSSCHWCTVMEGEAFSDESIAAYMNANFLPIKIDREERPDLDSIYMQALQMMVGQGGWPLNVFLLPESLVPFYGGTYFPVEPRYGRPGFLRVLQQIRHYYDTEKEKLQTIQAEMLDSLQQAAIPPGSIAETLDIQWLFKGLVMSTRIAKTEGPGTRFPMIPYADTALRGTRFALDSQYDADAITRQRGLDLALGGIFDHVGGGFHRYTVDPTWTVPHFEKMLYDNGQILEYLANLWSAGVREPAFERAIAKTVEWLKREMTAPEGYFYAAQDADSFTTPDDVEPEEGAFYVWSFDELQELLTKAEYAELEKQFTVSKAGNFEGKNVLQRRHPGALSQTAEAALDKLFVARYGSDSRSLEIFPPARNNDEAKTTKWQGRIPCVTDTKAIVAWNSLTISGLARSAAVFGNSEYFELAKKAANFILEHQWKGDRLHRLNYDGTVSVLAQSEDYALFIKALLDLHQASLVLDSEAEKAEFWLDKASNVQAEFDEFLWSIEGGGYYNTAKDASGDLIVRERSYMDNATPAANGIAIANLVRLALLSEDLSHLDRAEQTLQSFSSILEKSPQACPSSIAALDAYLHPLLVRTTPAQLRDLIPQYFPTVVFKSEAELPAGSVGLVCQGLSCLEPAIDRQQLLEQIRQYSDR
ncbi:MAG TPA: thioredoxin domain-containing protein [Oscillatoriales cyanobacterium M59_W2019_021]|nr:thioredoxin domain-containing protein [Oscillatoriales cyanobacterium M4454_W2019_049]HIK50141.1 thioredoxin domain-containing protein [Oscillatoriales cyanobacterium M59_W2019_021]